MPNKPALTGLRALTYDSERYGKRTNFSSADDVSIIVVSLDIEALHKV